MCLPKIEGWAILHPDGEIEMVYFFMGDMMKFIDKFRPRCTAFRVKLVEIEPLIRGRLV
jgi:acylphosphatase